MSLNAAELLDLMEEILDKEVVESEDEYSDDMEDEEEYSDEWDDEESDEEDPMESMVAAKKVIRGGKMVTIKAHTKRKLSPKQKAALAKARKKSHTGAANKMRAKSMVKARKM